MEITKKLARYVNEIGINIADLARKSGVPYSALYTSLKEDGSRELRADEFINICIVLKKNPMDFVDSVDVVRT